MQKLKRILTNYLPLLVMLAAVLVIGSLMLTGRLTVRQALQWAQDRPVLCAAVLLSLFVIKGFSVVIPHAGLCAAAGLVFSMPVAVLLNSIGTLLCLCVSYAIGYFTKTTTLEQKLDRHPKLKHYFVNARTFGFGFSYTLHVLGLSTEVLGVLFGMMRLAFWKYMLSSFLAIAPGMICFTILGAELSFRSPLFWVLLGGDCIIILSCLLYTRRRLKQPAPGSEQERAS